MYLYDAFPQKHSDYELIINVHTTKTKARLIQACRSLEKLTDNLGNMAKSFQALKFSTLNKPIAHSQNMSRLIENGFLACQRST